MANIWDEVEEVQEVQNTPQQQPTNDIWGGVEEVSTQPNLRLTGEVKKYNESTNPVRNAIRQIGRNTARFILPKKVENWFLGSKEDEEFLKKYNDDNVMSYEDAATLYKQGLISKDEFMKNTGLRLKLDSLKADAEYRDVRNTNIGKGAVDIGTAAIPFGGGGKVATTVAGKLTPYLGRKIATEAAKGAIIGGKAGLAHGVGYGLVDEDIYKRIYEKTKVEIKKLEEELTSLEKQKEINEKQQQNLNSTFSKCKKSALDYMSLRTPTKDQITRLIEKVEIDKDKKIYVYLKFPELLI